MDRARVDGTGHATPQEAAVASYPRAAAAHVIELMLIDETHAFVVVDTEPSHPMRVHCELRGDGWVATGDDAWY